MYSDCAHTATDEADTIDVLQYTLSQLKYLCK